MVPIIAICFVLKYNLKYFMFNKFVYLLFNLMNTFDNMSFNKVILYGYTTCTKV